VPALDEAPYHLRGLHPHSRHESVNHESESDRISPFSPSTITREPFAKSVEMPLAPGPLNFTDCQKRSAASY